MGSVLSVLGILSAVYAYYANRGNQSASEVNPDEPTAAANGVNSGMHQYHSSSFHLYPSLCLKVWGIRPNHEHNLNQADNVKTIPPQQEQRHPHPAGEGSLTLVQVSLTFECIQY